MKEAKPTITYFDDVPDDLKKYSNLLNNSQLVQVTPSKPPKELTHETIGEWKSDLFLIDYELTRMAAGEPPVSYQGGTLSNLLRENFPDFPMVLLTSPGLLRSYKGATGQLGSIDQVIFKEQITADPVAIAKLLSCLANGYSLLRDAENRDFSALCGIVGAKKNEREIIRESNPPVKRGQSISVGNDVVWDVSEAANWVRSVLQKFPGILFNSMSAAASLGISEPAFLHAETQDLLKLAEYSGVFANCGAWWWKSRLQGIAFNLVREEGLEPPVSKSFTEAFRLKKGVALEPSKCIWSNEPFADKVCYVLNKPVKREYALDYFPDQRPASMDPAVVSFKAIREDNRVIDEHFSEVGQQMLPKIRGMAPNG